jgi:hypothetical protein
MALGFECMQLCVHKCLTGTGIVRDGRFCRCSPSPPTRRTHAHAGCLQIGACRFPTHPGLLLDAPQRPSQSSQGYYLLSFRFAQDVAHADRSYITPCRIQRPRLLLSLAGFQLTLIGRIWVTAEAKRYSIATTTNPVSRNRSRSSAGNISRLPMISPPGWIQTILAVDRPRQVDTHRA